MARPGTAAWKEALAATNGLRIRWDEPLAHHTSFRIGGPADAVVWADTHDQLIAVHRLAQASDVPIFTLGRGSNLLVSDKGLRGIVLKLGADFERIAVDGTRVTAGSAVPMSVLSKECAKRGLRGVEFMFGIPGSVGGGVRMNAGAHGTCMADVVTAVVALGHDGALHELDWEALDFQYRDSALGNYVCAVDTVFSLIADDPATVEAKTKEYYFQRLESQPLSLPSAGCVFRNPDVRSAGKLIDECGLKGLSVGRARVSEKHANFIVASEGATASDVLALIEEVQRRIKEATGATLELEIKIIDEI